MRKINIKKNKKTQKLWRMKGCSKRKSLATKRLKGGCCGFPWFKSKKRKNTKSKKGGCGCDIQSGGCASCGVPMQSGGGINSPSGPSLVGSPWTGNTSSWGTTNHYSVNKYTPFDPQTQGIGLERDLNFKGGKKSKSRKNNHIKGGGLIPQDVIDIGGNIKYGLGSAYNSLWGYSQPVSPLPYKDQFVRI